jgi:hypothetical protein
MIPARDTKSRWVVSLRDDALAKISNSKIREYSETRDLSVLGIDTNSGLVEETGMNATLFQVEPLKQKYAHLADAENRNVFSLQAVFATHVVDSRNAPDGIVRRGDRIEESAIEALPIDIVKEIATVIIELSTGAGRGVTIPFSLPDGFWGERLDMTQMLARAAQKAVEAKESHGTGKTTEEKTATV